MFILLMIVLGIALIGMVFSSEDYEKEFGQESGYYGSEPMDDWSNYESSIFDDQVGSAMQEDDLFGFDMGMDINPANGLPMIGCIDIEGNAFGTDSSDFFDDFSLSSSFPIDDDFSLSSGFSMDDEFSSVGNGISLDPTFDF